MRIHGVPSDGITIPGHLSPLLPVVIYGGVTLIVTYTLSLYEANEPKRRHAGCSRCRLIRFARAGGIDFRAEIRHCGVKKKNVRFVLTLSHVVISSGELSVRLTRARHEEWRVFRVVGSTRGQEIASLLSATVRKSHLAGQREFQILFLFSLRRGCGMSLKFRNRINRRSVRGRREKYFSMQI